AQAQADMAGMGTDDAGTDDAGTDDAGMSMDDGGMVSMPDMAMAKGNGLTRCDKPKHTCVQCLVDDDCPNGKVCKSDVCGPGCTGGYADGCETHTDVNVANCGACGAVCSLANAQPKCVGGSCQVQNCNQGWGNCDGKPENGCEDNIWQDPLNCGACGAKCSS